MVKKNLFSEILNNVDIYYTNKIEKYGTIPQGVGWNGNESQFIRFEQLVKILPLNRIFSINDIGCGYGELINFLDKFGAKFYYKGYDISKKMILNARKLWDKHDNVSFTIGKKLKPAEFTLASGIYSVKLEFDDKIWRDYIIESINEINRASEIGFSFNMKSKYSDSEYIRENLYYADPLFFFDYCKKYFSRNVSLLHDYDLYEFTILVRK